jgi:predicted Zn-dependent protease
MKTKITIILIIVVVFTGVIVSCQSGLAVAGVGARVVDVGAQVGGALGVIDQGTASQISNIAQAAGTAVAAWERAAEEITPEQEYFIGRAVGANILTTYRIWNGNPALTNYLNLICAAITINSPRPDIFQGYHVAILDSNEINAFATPGGHIFVTRGLISVARSEDALAGVIAHEVAHIQLKHGLKSIRDSRIFEAIVVTGAAAASVATDMDTNQLTDVFTGSVGEIVQTLITNGFSREQEFEADNTAMALMAAAGYNPQGLIDMLRELRTVQTAGVGFGRTHPTPADRITNAERTVRNHNVADNSAHRQARFIAATR